MSGAWVEGRLPSTLTIEVDDFWVADLCLKVRDVDGDPIATANVGEAIRVAVDQVACGGGPAEITCSEAVELKRIEFHLRSYADLIAMVVGSADIECDRSDD